MYRKIFSLYFSVEVQDTLPALQFTCLHFWVKRQSSEDFFLLDQKRSATRKTFASQIFSPFCKSSNSISIFVRKLSPGNPKNLHKTLFLLNAPAASSSLLPNPLSHKQSEVKLNLCATDTARYWGSIWTIHIFSQTFVDQKETFFLSPPSSQSCLPIAGEHGAGQEQELQPRGELAREWWSRGRGAGEWTCCDKV